MIRLEGIPVLGRRTVRPDSEHQDCEWWQKPFPRFMECLGDVHYECEGCCNYTPGEALP